MNSLATRSARIPRLSRLGWLMALYAENHQRLEQLFELRRLPSGVHRSSVGDGLDLRIEVLEQHRYTTELRLTYAMQDPVTGEPDPSAYLRAYHDTRQVEATHCYVGRRWQDAIGMYPTTEQMLGHRFRMNTFLGKWLEYLGGQGHGRATLQRREIFLHEIDKTA